MTEFLQEYGKIVVSVLVILALVGIVVLFKTPIQKMFSTMFSDFFVNVNSHAGLPGATFMP